MLLVQQSLMIPSKASWVDVQNTEGGECEQWMHPTKSSAMLQPCPGCAPHRLPPRCVVIQIVPRSNGETPSRETLALWIFADIPLAPAAHAEACVVFEIETVCDPIIICADPPDCAKKTSCNKLACPLAFLRVRGVIMTVGVLPGEAPSAQSLESMDDDLPPFVVAGVRDAEFDHAGNNDLEFARH